MKVEDIASIELAHKGSLGKVTFFRYSISLNRRHQDQQDTLLSEVFDWIKGTGTTELQSVSASYAKGKKVLVITMSFEDNVLANLFINLESQQVGFSKKIEIAGTEGLFVFNSESETAFTSDCLPSVSYQFGSVNPDNQEWLDVINMSLVSKEVEVLL